MATMREWVRQRVDGLARAWYDRQDRRFERRYGLDLGGVTAPQDLDFSGEEAGAHTTSYQAVWSRNLATLLRHARRAAPHLRAFVDVGSGKGKACFYAAAHGRFDDVLGVEYSEGLTATALANLRRFGRDGIRFVRGDAAEFDLPDAPALVFMFNPFDAVVMERFLSRNLGRFARHGSLVAYANDAQRDTLARLGFETLFREPARKISLYRLRDGRGA